MQNVVVSATPPLLEAGTAEMGQGFRWEIITPFYERTNRMSYIDLSQPDPAAGDRLGVIQFKKRPTDTYWGEIGPRLGMTMTNPFKRTYAYLTDTTVGDSAFGQVLQGGASRTMQLDARIDF